MNTFLADLKKVDSFMNTIKRLIPSSFKTAVRAYREDRQLSRLEADWKDAVFYLKDGEGAQLSCCKNVLIVPTDPWTLIGAVGDDAMISASIGIVRQHERACQVYVMTGGEQANKVAECIGLRPLMLWADKGFVQNLRDELVKHEIGSVIVLGADVLDGYYGATIAAKLLVSADLAARLGAKVTVLGFSFNAEPVGRLRSIFDNLHSNVRLHAREQLSAERFSKFSRHPVTLVADSAFMLGPDQSTDEVSDLVDWANAARQRGRLIIGLNVHPMLIKSATSEQIESIVLSVLSAVENVDSSLADRISWVLIPHDYRDALGDDTCLIPIYERLRKVPGFDVKHITGRHRAATLKAMAGAMDGVIAGRMHLVIASLGMGVPVFALKYQDKFEGLLGLFGIDQEMSVTADELLFNPDEFSSRLQRFLRDISSLKIKVSKALPNVKAASRLNYSPIVKSD